MSANKKIAKTADADASGDGAAALFEIKRKVKEMA